MLLNIKNLTPILLGMMLAACGADNKLTSKTSETLRNVTGDSRVLESYRFIKGDHETQESNAECLALRARLLVDRKAFAVGDTWSAIEGTSQFASLDGTESEFNDARCYDAEAARTEGCKVLKDRLLKQGNALGETREWKMLDGNEAWDKLMDDYSKGQDMNCFPHVNL